MPSPQATVHVPPPRIKVFLPRIDDPPALITSVDWTVYHLLVLPRDWRVHALATVAHLHAELNGLPTFLVLDERTALSCSRGDMTSLVCGILTTSEPLVTGHLVPAVTMPTTEEYLGRVRAAEDACARLEDVRKPRRRTDGDAASRNEIEALSGRQWNGVPVGLEECPECGEWYGKCLAGREKKPACVRVRCRCEPPSCCALCRAPLHERRLGSSYYDGESGEVVYVPGLLALEHRCD